MTPDTGLLVPERSPADLARALTLLLAHPQRLAELRAAGAQRVQNAFDIRLHARRVEAFFLELVRPCGGAVEQ